MASAPWLPPTAEDEEALLSEDRLLADVAYLAGRGAAGLRELRRCVECANGAEWVRRIPLSSAVMRGHVRSTLRYLVEEVQVETVNTLVHGRAPLHVAVVWGRVDCAAYLLAHGAALELRCSEGQTAGEKARIRLERLEDKLLEDIPWKSDGTCIGKQEITRIRDEGKVLVDLFDAVEAETSYSRWASLHPDHRLARRFPSSIPFTRSEERRRLAVLRALAASGRAALDATERRPPPGAAAGALGDADAAAFDPGSLEAVMAAAGVGDLAEALQEQFGPFATADALRAARLSRREVMQVEGTEAEHRRLLRFLIELQQQDSKAGAKAKAKKGVDQRARTALAAAAAGGRAAPAAAAAAAPKAAAKVAKANPPEPSAAGAAAAPGGDEVSDTMRGLQLLFNIDMPIGAFISIAFFLAQGPAHRRLS